MFNQFWYDRGGPEFLRWLHFDNDFRWWLCVEWPFKAAIIGLMLGVVVRLMGKYWLGRG